MTVCSLSSSRQLAEVELDFNLDVTGFEMAEIDTMIEGSRRRLRATRSRRYRGRSWRSSDVDPTTFGYSTGTVCSAGMPWMRRATKRSCGDVEP